MSRKKEVIVSDVSKKHDNPIAELVQVACCFDSEIILESNNRKINAKSIMGIMAFNPTVGMSVDIVVDGKDEEEALQAMEKFLVYLHLMNGENKRQTAIIGGNSYCEGEKSGVCFYGGVYEQRRIRKKNDGRTGGGGLCR